MGLIFFAFFEKFFVPILTSGGYVGLSIATLLSQHHKVMAVDIVPEKVELINNKKSPIQDEYIEKYLAEKELDLTATLDAKEAYSDADFVVIAAPTNYDSKKNFFDTSAVEAVIKLVIEYNPEAIMVIKSTIPVGFTASVREKYHCDNIIFSPEFLRESKAKSCGTAPQGRRPTGPAGTGQAPRPGAGAVKGTALCRPLSGASRFTTPFCTQKNRRTGFPIRRQMVYLPNKSLCDPVRASVSTSTSSSIR